MCVSWCVQVLDCIRGLHLLTSVVGWPDGRLVGQTPCAHQEALCGFGPTPSCMLNPKSRVGAQQSGSRHVPVAMGPLFCCRPEFSHLQDGGRRPFLGGGGTELVSILCSCRAWHKWTRYSQELTAMCQGCLVSRWVGSDLQGPGCPDFMALSTSLIYLKLSC